jgi:hypothetical protein
MQQTMEEAVEGLCHRPIERFPYYLKARKTKVTKPSLLSLLFKKKIVNNNIFIVMV